MGSECLACPAALNGYSFFQRSTNNKCVPAVVTRVGAESTSDCLVAFAQVADTAWYMGGAVPLTPVPGVGSFDACVEGCRSDASCQYITYDYTAGAAETSCFKKTALINATR